MAGILLKIPLTLILILLLTPIYVAILALALVVRAFVKLTAKVCRPDLLEILHGPSVTFALEPVSVKPCSNIVFHLICDGKPSVTTLRQQFKLRLLPPKNTTKSGDRYSRLRQRWTTFLGFSFWQPDPTFRMDNHIRMYDYTDQDLVLPELCGEEDLERVTGALLAKPYVAGRSPWEILIVPCYRSTTNADGHDQYVLVFRIHHALADGISIIKLLLRLFDQEGTSVAQARFPEVSWWEGLVQSVLTVTQGPFQIVSRLIDCYDGDNCWHKGGKRMTNKHHVFLSDPFPVQEIKAIMRKFSVNYNAAIYAVTAGAIVKLMSEMSDRPPSKLSVFVPFPRKDHPGGLVNHVGADMFCFHPKPTSGSSSSVLHLREISRCIKSASHFSPFINLLMWAGDWAFKLPNAFLLHSNQHLNHVTLAMTNIPGPEVELDAVGGGRLVEIIPAIGTIPGNCGAIATMVSTAGSQRIGLSVDQAILRGRRLPQSFPVYVREEIDNLLNSREDQKGKTVQKA